ncbi:hypothetical protein [Halosimplex salinum]|uniref:hypothetical protein n=1 Tax=Halosimplex salinum TaxID=1710538 RepID=UPI0013DDEF47|nr:hypothetical protein [Halosimplex salinum]
MRETHRDLTLVALGVVLLAAAAVVPVDAVRWHDTSVEQPDFAEGNATELRSDGYEIVAYETLSERGRELYVATLENGGQYRVSPNEGADDFDYRTRAELLGDANVSGLDAGRAMQVVVERPNGTAELPPADEESPDARYDAVLTKTAPPPLLSVGRAHQLALALAGLGCFGYGGSRFVTL